MKVRIKERIEIKIPDDYLLLYRLLARTRALNEAIIVENEHIPGIRITGLGQEISSVVPLFALHKLGILEDSVKNCEHRTVSGTAVVVDYFKKEADDGVLVDFLRSYFTRGTGGNYGRRGNVHWMCLKKKILGLGCSHMGLWPGVAVGMAEELRAREWLDTKKGKRPVAISFFGDGAAQQGGVHEAMNWVAASNYKHTPEEIESMDERFLDSITRETRVVRGAPIIFYLHDNKRALFTNGIDQHGNSDLVRRADGYGDMVGVRVDGFDPVALFKATVKAVERAQMLRSTLIVLDTYRLTGHNEAQIERRGEAVKLGDFFNVSNIAGYSKEGLGEFQEAILKEPIFHGWSNDLIALGYAHREKLDGIVREERAHISSLVQKVLSEPKITVTEHGKDHSVFPVFGSKKEVVSPNADDEKKEMTYAKAFTWILGELFGEDESTIYNGEDIAEGGVLNLTPGLLKKFGPQRVFNTPLSEKAIIATSLGRSLRRTVFAEFQFAPFFGDAFDVLASALSPQWFQEKTRYSLITIFPCGVVHSGGSGNDHESWPERFLLPMEGIVVLAPASAYEVVGLLRSAYEAACPVALLLQISAAGLPEFRSEVPLKPYSIPLGKAHVAREGKDVTVVAYGAAAVSAAKNEADSLEKEQGVSVEVINLRTVHPWDLETIKTSVKKTGRCIIFHEDYAKKSAGQILKGELEEDLGFLEYIKTPTIKVLGADYMFVPTDTELAWARLPYERIGKGVNIRHRSAKLRHLIEDAVTWN